MKRARLVLTIIVVLPMLFATIARGQCDTLRHNKTWFDGWISCEASPNPNVVRGNSHWILYNFGQQYTLFETRLWNTNSPDLLEYGVQNIVIDISSDGENWSEVGEFLVPQSPGTSLYEGTDLMTFDSTNAQYVLITAIDNYGGPCYGFSEIRIHARDLCRENRILWIGGDGDWDVAANWCNNAIPTEFDDVTIPSGSVVTIPYLYTAHVANIVVEPGAEFNMIGNLIVHNEE